MTTSSLPRQILVLVFAAFITVQTILWGSLYSVRETMNVDASEESQRRMDGRLKTLQGQVSLIASDYHNWTDIFLNAHALDYERLASNYGITAERGDVFQYAELYDGPFPQPISWRAGRGLAPQEGFVDEFTRTALRDLVRTLDVAERQTVDYFELRDGRLVMFSSSRLLPEDDDLLGNLDPQAQAVALIGKVLSEGLIASIGAEFSMTDLKVVDGPHRLGAVNLPAIGISGEPVAWLEWYPPTPGTVLFRKMAPIMLLISVIFAVMFFWGARLLRYRATKLIAQEAVSFEQARTDALTALPNRLALHEHLASITADGTLNCAIVAMDLNSFKRINDNVGHFGGDLFLETFAARLRTLADDETFIARLGGDEFVLVISSTGPLEQTVARKCASLDEIARDQIACNGVHFDVMVAKGVAMMRSHEFCDEELLQRADRALYAAKARGTQKVIHYDDQMACEDRDRQTIESRLRGALVDGDGFFIAYQPIVAAGDMRDVTRYEALARWYCRECGQISPDKFIHVAETSGLIVRLGWLLLDLICRDIKGVENCKFGVNISPVQLMTPGFADLFAARVKANGVRPEQIEVEVTEQIVVRDDITIAQELNILRRHGFSLALDDFGTGYASIGYLTRMPFDVLKIDRSFAKFHANNMQFQRMVRSMVGLAHAMDLRIIAEGIETQEEAVWFRDLGADFLQGYHFGGPAQIADHPSLSARIAGQ
jgi:diguanylate cyclase (GGDEF)-like protein